MFRYLALTHKTTKIKKKTMNLTETVCFMFDEGVRLTESEILGLPQKCFKILQNFERVRH